MPISRDSSQDQLTDNIVTLALTEIPSSTRKFSRSVNAMASLNHGLDVSEMHGVRIDDASFGCDRLNNNITDDDCKSNRKKRGWSFMNPISDCAVDCYSFTCDICLSYYKWVLFILYNIYWIFGIHRTWHATTGWGNGIKFLTILTVIWYLFALYYICLKKYVVKPFFIHVIHRIAMAIDNKCFLKKYFKVMIWGILIAAAIIYCIIITSGNRYRLVSGVGLIGFLAFGYLMSEHKQHINWNQVLWGLAMQFCLALLVLRTTFGKDLFNTIGDKITTFLQFTDNGSSFLFGYLVTGKMEGNDLSRQPAIFAFKVLPVILFFSFFTSILYYYGIMQRVVEKAGWLLQSLIGTTPCESLNAAANIFLGMTEAPLLIKPYIPVMTKSELFAVMTGGFATIAGSVLAAYINFGVSAAHLLTASVMAAPSALGYSKLFYPETEESRTAAGKLEMIRGFVVSSTQMMHPMLMTQLSCCRTESNALEAAGNGASQAIKICSNIAGNLIAFLAFIQFLDTMCIWLGANVDMDFISFKWILSHLFIPIALMMGIELEDCYQVAKMIGLKTMVNEFVAYTELAEQIRLQSISVRSQAIATYALCGFSNFSSIGITLGAMGSLVPERKSDLSSLAFKAMICGSTVTFTSACMAGLLIDDDTIINAMSNSTTT